jgi:hypothetical protein
LGGACQATDLVKIAAADAMEIAVDTVIVEEATVGAEADITAVAVAAIPVVMVVAAAHRVEVAVVMTEIVVEAAMIEEAVIVTVRMVETEIGVAQIQAVGI